MVFFLLWNECILRSFGEFIKKFFFSIFLEQIQF